MSERAIYFLKPIGQDGPIKIGSSINPIGRLKTYQIWSPVVLELAAHTMAHHNTECFLHRHFRPAWLHGEWYEATAELLGLIEHVAATDTLPAWVNPPRNPVEFRAFCAAYPVGSGRGFPKKEAA